MLNYSVAELRLIINLVENIIRIVFYEEKRNTKIKNLSNRWYQFEKKI